MDDGAADRAYWVDTLDRIVRPVWTALSQRKLVATMPVEVRPGSTDDRRPMTYLEALGRSLAGAAPWLELGPDSGPEGRRRRQLITLARDAVAAAVDPQSPDRMDFTGTAQALVDAAFLAHALLRSPTQLWGGLDAGVQRNLVAALASSRRQAPGLNNWLLFAAAVEAFLFKAGQPWQAEPVDRALSHCMDWYLGDGVYGDGPALHVDYYNSFVVQPMLVDVVDAVGGQRPAWAALREPVLKRARRFAAIQERLISPGGTFPGVGRSLSYRFGAFQLLAQMALRRQLPDETSPAQVRPALTAVVRRMIEAPGTFDDKGYLTIGFCGHQPNLAEPYVSTGSLYLCATGLLPLGLPATDEFWTCHPQDWTSKRLWAGQDVSADRAMEPTPMSGPTSAPAAGR